ncbi:MAG: mechanosensitive ion channel [Alphaproteobacteria bacterium]|nr:mechanosensitive ion channel [Alphaproteobacteria bacterium]
MEDLLKYLVVDKIPWALGVAITAFVVIRVGTRSLDALAERFTEYRLTFKQIIALGRVSVLLLATVAVGATVFQLSGDTLILLSSGLGIVAGFAFQKVGESVLSGILLLFDRPFQLGDRVAFAGQYGEIVEIGLRTTRMATLDDNLITIPNNLFLSGAVSCANAGALDQMCVWSFYIGCNQDFAKAKDIVYEATAASNYVYLEKPIVVVVREGPVPEGAERFAIKIAVKAYVFDGRYETAFGTDVTERVKRAFREHHIRTAGELEWGPPGSGADGRATPAHPHPHN